MACAVSDLARVGYCFAASSDCFSSSSAVTAFGPAHHNKPKGSYLAERRATSRPSTSAPGPGRLMRLLDGLPLPEWSLLLPSTCPTRLTDGSVRRSSRMPCRAHSAS